MKKNKKTSKQKKAPDLDSIPAYLCFCAEKYDLGAECYVWQSWGLVIRHLRDYTGMDQSIFGRLLRGYTRGQIGRYETEESEPPIDFWVKMMRTFGLNVNWALTGKGKPYILEYQNSEERKRFFEWERLIGEKEDFLRELKGW